MLKAFSISKRYAIILSALALITACGPLATATPAATIISAAPLATATFTRVPASPTLAITATPTLSPTPARPSLTPTRTRAATTPTTRPAATATKPPSPKGSIAYRVNKAGVDRMDMVNLETGTTTPLLDLGPAMDIAQTTNAHFAEFSPDGSKLAFVFAGQLGQANVVYVMDTNSGKRVPVFSSEPGGGISSPTWLPDSKRVALIRMSANQKLWGIHTINADGTGGQNDLRIQDQAEQYRGGMASSRQGVFALAMNTTGKSDIYRLFLDGAGFLNLTNHPADDTTPVWSPDGKLIAFTSTREGRAQIYVMNADGAGARRVSNSPFADFSPAWSPDGNWIAFASTREGSTDVYLMDLRGGNVRRITTGGGDYPIWAP